MSERPLRRTENCTVGGSHVLHGGDPSEREIAHKLPLAHALVAGGRVRVQAIVASPDGSEIIRGEAEGAVGDAAATGQALGAELLERGARRILAAVYA